MTIISIKVNSEKSKLIHDYVFVNKLKMSRFVLDKIESDLELDEAHILRVKQGKI